ncbi:membrane protein [Comamonas phosphati]|nr:membrane protein [Comamonas phosphati]
MLLDDIAALLDDVALMTRTAAAKSTAAADDVAVMTKVAMGKTAGVLGDDLALNAEQVTGVRASRELPVVWAVAKGSLKNKAFLIPAALLISAFVPWLITPLLIVGGAFLCFEGVEKTLELFHKHQAPDVHEAEIDAQQASETGVAPSSVRAARAKDVDPVAYEKAKVAGAVRTDFILSAEIMAIALGTVAEKPIWEQALVLIAVALAITVFVYGLVAAIVRMDDVGGWLMARASRAAQAVGRGLIGFTPWLMKGLSIVGTAAMFLVGGSLLVHGMAPIAHWLHDSIESLGGVIAAVVPYLVHVGVGAAVGGLVVACVQLWHKLRPAQAAH